MDGVVFMVWGQAARDGAAASIASLRQFSALPVAVVGDRAAEALVQTAEGVSHVLCKSRPFGQDRRFYAGRIKPLLCGLSPFDRTLYVDADTLFVRGPEVGFDLLDVWDFMATDTGHRSLIDDIAGAEEAAFTRDLLGAPHMQYHCSGVLFWRRCAPVEDLFSNWARAWAEFKGWDEQLALLRALARTPAVAFLTLPYTWGTRHREEAFLVYHAFGSKAVRAHK